MVWRRIKQPEASPEKTLPELPPLPPQEEKPIISKKKTEYEVVFKLPTQEIRQYQRDDGTIVKLITVEEALTEFINGDLE
jgi:hypothetical protein